MKRFLLVIAAVLILIGFAGCSGSSAGSKTSGITLSMGFKNSAKSDTALKIRTNAKDKNPYVVLQPGEENRTQVPPTVGADMWCPGGYKATIVYSHALTQDSTSLTCSRKGEWEKLKFVKLAEVILTKT